MTKSKRFNQLLSAMVSKPALGKPVIADQTSSADADKNKFGKMMQEIIRIAQKKGLSDWEFIDQLPDSKIKDELIPFPYGGGKRNFNSIDSY